MRSRRIEVHHDVILSAIEEQVDITLVELAEMLRSEHGAVFAPSTIWRFLDRHSMTIKKNSARQRAGAARRSEGRAHVRTPVTNANIVCSLRIEKKNNTDKNSEKKTHDTDRPNTTKNKR